MAPGISSLKPKRNKKKKRSKRKEKAKSKPSEREQVTSSTSPLRNNDSGHYSKSRRLHDSQPLSSSPSSSSSSSSSVTSSSDVFGDGEQHDYVTDSSNSGESDEDEKFDDIKNPNSLMSPVCSIGDLCGKSDGASINLSGDLQLKSPLQHSMIMNNTAAKSLKKGSGSRQERDGKGSKYEERRNHSPDHRYRHHKDKHRHRHHKDGHHKRHHHHHHRHKGKHGNHKGSHHHHKDRHHRPHKSKKDRKHKRHSHKYAKSSRSKHSKSPQKDIDYNIKLHDLLEKKDTITTISTSNTNTNINNTEILFTNTQRDLMPLTLPHNSSSPSSSSSLSSSSISLSTDSSSSTCSTPSSSFLSRHNPPQSLSGTQRIRQSSSGGSTPIMEGTPPQPFTLNIPLSRSSGGSALGAEEKDPSESSLSVSGSPAVEKLAKDKKKVSRFLRLNKLLGFLSPVFTGYKQKSNETSPSNSPKQLTPPSKSADVKATHIPKLSSTTPTPPPPPSMTTATMTTAFGRKSKKDTIHLTTSTSSINLKTNAKMNTSPATNNGYGHRRNKSTNTMDLTTFEYPSITDLTKMTNLDQGNVVNDQGIGGGGESSLLSPKNTPIILGPTNLVRNSNDTTLSKKVKAKKKKKKAKKHFSSSTSSSFSSSSSTSTLTSSSSSSSSSSTTMTSDSFSWSTSDTFTDEKSKGNKKSEKAKYSSTSSSSSTSLSSKSSYDSSSLPNSSSSSSSSSMLIPSKSLNEIMGNKDKKKSKKGSSSNSKRSLTKVDLEDYTNPMFSELDVYIKSVPQSSSSSASGKHGRKSKSPASKGSKQEKSTAANAEKKVSLLKMPPDDAADTYKYFFEIDENYNPYPYIQRICSIPRPPVTKKNILGKKPVDAPKVTLVLDLDETLVHCTTERSVQQPAITFSVMWNGGTYFVSAMKRPFLQEFMEEVSNLFEVVIFTASQKVYANKLLDIIDPEFKWSKKRLFRESCAFIEGNYIKDLAVLGRDISKVVIIDNSPQAFALQYDNALPISSWFEDSNDSELVKVLPLLRKLAVADDVRPILRKRFKLYKKIEF